MRLRISVFLCLTIVAVARVSSETGIAAYSFLEMPASAYQAAMGGGDVALTGDGINNVFVNPALMGDETCGNLTLGYSRYLNVANVGQAGYGHNWGKNRFGFGVRYMDYGSFDGYDVYGMEVGEFSARDVALVVGYSRTLYDGLSIGIALKPIFSQYERYSSFGLGVDVGLAYSLKKYHLNMALALQNAGRQLKTYEDDVQRLPLNLAFSINKGFTHAPFAIYFTYHHIQDWSLDYVDRVTTTNMLGVEESKEIGGADMFFRHTLFGLDFLPWHGRLRLSVSYNHRRAQELKMIDSRSIAGFSFGAGVRLTKFNVGIGASQYQSGIWNWQFNVGINFNKILKNRE